MTRYAFMIGCEKYSNFANIAFCEGDVILIQETLVKYCDYEYKNMERVFQYKGCDDTPDIIYNKLQKMIDRTEKGDSILFYFAVMERKKMKRDIFFWQIQRQVIFKEQR